MGDLTRQVTISAPAKRIFDYVADPHNAPDYISSINSIVSGPQGAPGVPTDNGLRQVWKARVTFLGKPSTIDLCLQQMVPGRSVRFEIQGEPRATLLLTLLPGEDGKHTAVSLEMEVPSVPGLLLNAMMGSMLQSDLSRLKRIMESD